MEFGKHLSKGLWAFADKSLPAIYGVGFIFLVVRVLPEKEFGSFVLIQTLFTMATAFCTALALQPLTKFAAETKENGSYIVASLVFSAAFYALATALLLLFHPLIVPLLDKRGETNLDGLLWYVPLLFLTSFYRTFAVSLLQASYRIKHIFWIDAVYFLGTLAMMAGAQSIGRFSTADDVVIINIIAQAFSTLLAVFLTRDVMSVPLTFHKESFKKMWDFGKYSFGANVSYMFVSQADVFLISNYSGVASLAVYNAAKLFTRFFDVVSQVLQMLVLPVVSKHFFNKEKEKINIIVEKAICFSSLLLLPVFVVMLLFPGYLLEIVYGDKYASATLYMQIFAFLALITPWNSVTASVLNGMGKVKLGFLLGIAFALFSLTIYIILTFSIGSIGIALALVITALVTGIVLTLFSKKYLDFRIINVFIRISDAFTFIRKISSINYTK